MAEPAPRPNRALLLKLAVAGVVLLAGAVLVARGLDLKALVAQGLDLIRGAGPVVFFAAMAFLPAAGVPFLVFLLPVVSLFGPRFGTPVTIALALAAMTVNIAFTYALARWALRPGFAWLVARLGYKVPVVPAEDATDLIVLLRVTPGIPFCVQHYLLGLAGVPFGKYLLLSCLITGPMATAFMLFGDALLHGKGKIALLSLSLVLAVTAALHLVRKHYGKKRA
jgi:uncharacterized membrane protein YdjX (TVP38/TMEM64 family)